MSDTSRPLLIDEVNLVGWDVLEVGIRQAWPFLTFGSPGDRAERRLFIDTDYVVSDSAGADLKGADLARLESLVMLVVEDMRRDSAGLRIKFDNQASITISDEANAQTTGDVWWLTDPL